MAVRCPILTQGSPPAAFLSRDAAKEHARIDAADTTFDAEIDALTLAVNAHIDGPFGLVGRALISQVWTVSMPRVTGSARVAFPILPFVSLDSIAYFDSENSTTALATSSVRVFNTGNGAAIEPVGSWPAMFDRPDALTLTGTVGYGAAASDVPAGLLHAAKLIFGHWFEHREAAIVGRPPSELPMGVHHLIAPYKVRWIS